MMDHNSTPPDVASVSSSGTFTVPLRQPRRRRRPALSCNECRRRKVKCDQKQPCTPCTKSKTAVCKYDPDATPKGREFRANITPLNTHSSPSLRRIGLNPASMRNTNPSNATLLPNPTHHGATSTLPHDFDNPVRPDRTAGGQSVQELNERIKQLETMVASLVDTDQESQAPAEKAIDTPNNDIFPKLRGSTHKSKFFTISHWMNVKKEFHEIHDLKKTRKHEQSSELNQALKKCKDLARAIKLRRPSTNYTLPDLKAEMPLRATSDLLVQLYFRTFESTYRILHRQSFFREYEQYWTDPTAANDSFIVKLLLVMAIGTIFTEEENMAMRLLGLQWINSAQAWLNTPLDRSRLNIASVEVQCLLILARQTHSVSGDLLWISVGSLIRTAMTIGLHRDPSNFPKISVFQAEIRRRIWATIIELAIQASLDCGMPPMFSFEEFDTAPPSNYDDADIIEATQTYPPKKVDSVFTESSAQIALLKSLQTRFQIFKIINDFRTPPSYEKVLALSTELKEHISSHSALYSSPSLTSTHKSLLDLLTRRFLLALHLPFSIRSKTEPRYYFSRKLTLDTSLLIFSYPSDSDFDRMKLISGGPFREAFSRASLAISLELITQIQENSTSFPPLSSISAFPIMGSSADGFEMRKPLHDVLDEIIALSRKRLERGETNVKGYLFWRMVQAQTRAMEKGETDLGGSIEKGAREGAEDAFAVLKGQVGEGSEVVSVSESRGSPGDLLGVDWDALMQNSVMDFDVVDTWLLDSWETI